MRAITYRVPLTNRYAQSSSAFGIKPSNQTGTSLFGQSAANPQGSLFGGTSQPSTTSFGSFGTQPQNQGAPQGSSLFGTSLGQNQQQQPAQGSSLFGGGFGQPQQPQQNASTSLFGQANTQQKPPTAGFFGQPAANTQQQSTLGSSIFGTQNQQSNQPGQQQSGFGGSLGTSTNIGATPGQSTGFGGWGSSNPLQAQPTQPASTFGASTGSIFGNQPSQQQ